MYWSQNTLYIFYACFLQLEYTKNLNSQIQSVYTIKQCIKIYKKQQMHQSLCDQCLHKINNKQSHNQHPQVSLGFLHNLSLQLHFSFQSISLLTDCAINRNATNFSIRIVKMQNNSQLQLPMQAMYEENYIQLKFNGDVLTNNQANLFANFNNLDAKVEMKQQENKDQFNFSRMCRLGMLGLGKTNILICNDGQYHKIILLSTDDRINPKYYKNSHGYLWIQNQKTKQIQNFAGQFQKNMILQACKIFHVDQDILFQCPAGQFKILIFHAKIFVTSKKLMFYELSQSQFNRDIQIYHNPSKIQFLDKLGYQLAKHAQISLSGYYSLLYLRPTLKMTIGNNQQEYHGLTYQMYLDNLDKNGMLEPIITEKQLVGTTRVKLYNAKESYFAHNNGILFYVGGRLINRYDVEFGKMFQECFYRKKYRQPPKNIFKVLGFVEFKEEYIKTNLIRTEINSLSPFYRQFIAQLNQIIETGELKENTDEVYDQYQQQLKKKQEDALMTRQKYIHTRRFTEKQRKQFKESQKKDSLESKEENQSYKNIYEEPEDNNSLIQIDKDQNQKNKKQKEKQADSQIEKLGMPQKRVKLDLSQKQ